MQKLVFHILMMYVLDK